MLNLVMKKEANEDYNHSGSSITQPTMGMLCNNMD